MKDRVKVQKEVTIMALTNACITFPHLRIGQIFGNLGLVKDLYYVSDKELGDALVKYIQTEKF